MQSRQTTLPTPRYLEVARRLVERHVRDERVRTARRLGDGRHAVEPEVDVVEVVAAVQDVVGPPEQEPDLARVGVAVAPERAGALVDEADRVLHHLGKLARLRRRHRTAPDVRARIAVRPALVVDADRVVDGDAVDEVRVASADEHGRVPGEPPEVRAEVEVLRHHLAARSLHVESVRIAVVEGDVPEGRMVEVRHQQTGRAAVSVQHAARDARARLAALSALDEPHEVVHLRDRLENRPLLELERAVVRHDERTRHLVRARGDPDEPARIRVHLPLQHRLGCRQQDSG